MTPETTDSPDRPGRPDPDRGNEHAGHTLIARQNGLYCRDCDEELSLQGGPHAESQR